VNLNITLYGPSHTFWRSPKIRAWFYQPDRYSTGGVGFKVPFLHICFMWGRRP
jgi:hypothetical protein